MIREASLNFSLRFQLEFRPNAAWRRGYGGTGFSLGGLILASAQNPQAEACSTTKPN